MTHNTLESTPRETGAELEWGARKSEFTQVTELLKKSENRLDIVGKGLITAFKKYYVQDVMGIKCRPKATKRRKDNPEVQEAAHQALVRRFMHLDTSLVAASTSRSSEQDLCVEGLVYTLLRVFVPNLKVKGGARFGYVNQH